MTLTGEGLDLLPVLDFTGAGPLQATLAAGPHSAANKRGSTAEVYWMQESSGDAIKMELRYSTGIYAPNLGTGVEMPPPN